MGFVYIIKAKGECFMKVILIQDLKGKGKKGDVIDVNPIYAMNVLIKQKIAIEATANNLNENKGQKNAQAFHHGELVKKYQAIADSLKDKTITVGLKFGANGKAFGSITKQEVFNKLVELNIPAEKKMILDFEPIKTIGDYKVTIQFMKEVKCEIKVQVVEAK